MSLIDQKAIAVEYSRLADIRREDQFESFIPAQDDYYDGEPTAHLHVDMVSPLLTCMLTNVLMFYNRLVVRNDMADK